MTPIEKLMDSSIAIRDSILVRNVIKNKTEVLTIDFSKLTDKTYEVCSNTVAFVSDEVLYVIPLIKGIITLLEDEGYTHELMNVPFTGFTYPASEKERKKWDWLTQISRYPI